MLCAVGVIGVRNVRWRRATNSARWHHLRRWLKAYLLVHRVLRWFKRLILLLRRRWAKVYHLLLPRRWWLLLRWWGHHSWSRLAHTLSSYPTLLVKQLVRHGKLWLSFLLLTLLQGHLFLQHGRILPLFLHLSALGRVLVLSVPMEGVVSATGISAPSLQAHHFFFAIRAYGRLDARG